MSPSLLVNMSRCMALKSISDISCPLTLYMNKLSLLQDVYFFCLGSDSVVVCVADGFGAVFCLDSSCDKCFRYSCWTKSNGFDWDCKENL